MSGRLQSIHGNRNGKRYRLLVNSGAGINLIEKELVKKIDKPFKFVKTFVMGKDKHQITEAVYIEYLGKKQLFHIIPEHSPIPEDGIIREQFFKKYNKYAITPKFSVLGNKKLRLHNDGEFIPTNSTKILKIRTEYEKEDVFINPG